MVEEIRELEVEELESVSGGCNCCDCADICLPWGSLQRLLSFFRRSGI